MAILSGMPAIMKKTGHACPKNSRRYCHDILHIFWEKRQPQVDEALIDERQRAYNEGTLDELLRKKKNR